MTLGPCPECVRCDHPDDCEAVAFCLDAYHTGPCVHGRSRCVEHECGECIEETLARLEDAELRVVGVA